MLAIQTAAAGRPAHLSGRVKIWARRQAQERAIWDARSTPVLVVVVCFLVIANTRCDHVGSSNGKLAAHQPTRAPATASLDALLAANGRPPAPAWLPPAPAWLQPLPSPSRQAPQPGPMKRADGEALPPASKPRVAKKAPVARPDPLSFLREIYLDHDSKIIKMLLPPGGPGADTVQKFHPNGRYGRSSLDQSLSSRPETRAELARLNNSNEEYNLQANLLRRIESHRQQQQQQQQQQQEQMNAARRADMQLLEESAAGQQLPSSVASLEHELGKLLSCSYAGVANLYWCANL